jgi:probable F420-dependent oxidoreductase
MDTVVAARRAIGSVGVVLPVMFTSTPPADLQREAARRLEAAGYGAAWTNEVIGKDAFVQLSLQLGVTRRMAFGTGISNIWAREPQTEHGAAALLAQAFPDRFLLGLGVGYPEQAAGARREFGSPLATMRDYVERMGAQTWPPAPDVAYPRLIAANGPKMLALAGEIADGALPATLPPAFTAQAREILGPDKLLCMGMNVVPDTDRDRAREAARDLVRAGLGRPAYAAMLARFGFSGQDIADVSDRLVDAIVGHGEPAAIAAKVREHLAAGADHVQLMVPVGTDYATGIRQLEQLAPAVLS